MHEERLALHVVLHHRCAAKALRGQVLVFSPAGAFDVLAWDGPSFPEREEGVAEDVLVAVGEGEEERPVGRREHVRDENQAEADRKELGVGNQVAIVGTYASRWWDFERTSCPASCVHSSRHCTPRIDQMAWKGDH